jgi:hypothetical protein
VHNIIIEIGTKCLTSLFSFSWLYNLFSDNIAGSLKGSLSDQVLLSYVYHYVHVHVSMSCEWVAGE